MAVSRRLVNTRFPYLPVSLRIRQRTVDVDALVDTGFDGHMVIPSDSMAGEIPDANLLYGLADGLSFVWTPLRAL